MKPIKILALTVLLLVAIKTKAQSFIDWDGVYKIQLSDFQSVTTQVGNTNIYSMHTMSGMDFSFEMSNGEFMFAKNFNSKVNCRFRRESASIVAPDSALANDLVDFARFEFDLSELYARKFRKKLYDGKGIGSSVNFFQPIYNNIQKEYTERDVQAGKDTDLGRNKAKLKELHDEVLKEIAEMPDYCKACKPSKKKKK